MASFQLRTGEEVLVDDEDLPSIAVHHWYRLSASEPYVVRRVSVGGRRRWVFLHRVISGAPGGVEVDHANCDPLDNRRSNLRFASAAENRWNHPISPGRVVGVRRRWRGWQARIRIDGREVHLGTFPTAGAAASAYDEAAGVHRGSFARLNGAA